MKKITINIYYTGVNSSARKFVQEMISSGIVDEIKAEEGNLRYDYFYPVDDNETVLLIDCWENQNALDLHHASPMMSKITELRKKYNLSMRVERFVSNDEDVTDNDKRYMLR